MVKQTVKETSIDELIKVLEKLPDSEAQKGWLGWLREYGGPGAYNRKPGMNYSARFMYNHNASPSGLLWLIQELGITQELVKFAKADYKRAEKVSKDKHTLSAVIRKRVPWTMVDHAITERLLSMDEAYKRKLLRAKKAAI